MRILITTIILIGQSIIIRSDLSIDKCHLTDGTCLKLTAQKLLPALLDGGRGMALMDPMRIADVRFQLAGLTAYITDTTVKGLRKSVIDKLKFDTKKREMHLTSHGDLAISGRYKAGGRLLILPITGDGEIHLKMKHMRLNVTTTYELVGEKGSEAMALSGYKYVYEVLGNAHFNLTNLFNGNKKLSEVMLNFMNANWKQITEEFGGPLVEAATKEVYENIRDFLKKQPLKEIALIDNESMGLQ